MDSMRRTCLRLTISLSLAASVLGAAAPSAAEAPQPQSDGILGAMAKSLTGDVYAEPSRWRELSLGTLFSEGWDESWVSPPAGEGGAPRQGWLNAYDGVFYRLGIATFGFADDFNDNGNQYTGGLTSLSAVQPAVRAANRRSVCGLEPRAGTSTTPATAICNSRRACCSPRRGTSPSRST